MVAKKELEDDKKVEKIKSYEVYPELLDFISIGSKLTIDDIEKLEQIFGERVKKALELVGRNRVKRYVFKPSNIVRWVVNGHNNDYLLIESSFCTCKDFLFKAIMKKNIPSCYHLLAREIAERTNKFTEIVEEDQNYNDFMKRLV